MADLQVFIPQVYSEVLGEKTTHTLCKDPTNDDQLTLIKPCKPTKIYLVSLPGHFEQRCKILRQMRVTMERIMDLVKKFCTCCK